MKKIFYAADEVSIVKATIRVCVIMYVRIDHAFLYFLREYYMKINEINLHATNLCRATHVSF